MSGSSRSMRSCLECPPVSGVLSSTISKWLFSARIISFMTLIFVEHAVLLVAHHHHLYAGMPLPFSLERLDGSPALGELHAMAVAIQQVFRAPAIDADHGDGGAIRARALALARIHENVDVQNVREHLIRCEPRRRERRLGASERIEQHLRRDNLEPLVTFDPLPVLWRQQHELT